MSLLAVIFMKLGTFKRKPKIYVASFKNIIKNPVTPKGAHLKNEEKGL